MSTKELEQKLKLEYNSILTKEFEYNKNKYARATKFFNNIISYLYFEIENDDIKLVSDLKLLNVFNSIYEQKDNEIIY